MMMAIEINCGLRVMILIDVLNKRITPRFSGRAITASCGKLSMRDKLSPVRCKRLLDDLCPLIQAGLVKESLLAGLH